MIIASLSITQALILTIIRPLWLKTAPWRPIQRRQMLSSCRKVWFQKLYYPSRDQASSVTWNWTTQIKSGCLLPILQIFVVDSINNKLSNLGYYGERFAAYLRWKTEQNSDEETSAQLPPTGNPIRNYLGFELEYRGKLLDINIPHVFNPTESFGMKWSK